jgi:hypothetical protein
MEEELTNQNNLYSLLIETMIKTQAIEDILLEKHILTSDALKHKHEVISKAIVDIINKHGDLNGKD